ncbi:hypothetical protein [Klebsiella pneumoniae]|uniref:hypothetical protein n=1 Tax=Klebsiella pneumoniae TaxID=573 RepID=UPI0022B6F229|nr:hypothetical protein [Klebsiella pneumoniae]
MIVKFIREGKRAAAGQDYLLGKTPPADGAIVLAGKKPGEVRELIDLALRWEKYIPGVLSFVEQDLPPGQREKLMASFERVLMPGLDKDQHSAVG